MTADDCHLHYASWQAYLYVECMNTFVFQPMQCTLNIPLWTELPIFVQKQTMSIFAFYSSVLNRRAVRIRRAGGKIL